MTYLLRSHTSHAGALAAMLLAFVFADLGFDIGQRSPRGHLAAEAAATAVVLGGIALVGARLHRERARSLNLTRDLDVALREEQQRRDELQHLVAAADAVITQDFDRWGLTAAEREVTLLLLEGLRHKEVAHARQTSERTVRQQALSVYRKAGVEGRSELSAYFLERLLGSRTRSARAIG